MSGSEVEDDHSVPEDFEAQLAADLRCYEREQRWAALRMLWGPPIVNVASTRRRRDGVIDYERRRGEEWTLGRALVATVALIVNRPHGQREADRHRERTGSFYVPSVDLGFWDSRSDDGGWGYAYLNLYPGWRVSVGTDWESSM